MTDEAMTEGAALPVPAEPRAVAPRDFRAGTAALAEMSQGEFEVRLAGMRRGRERLSQIHKELMNPETDYGLIPGTPKPTLLKPGAEKLCDFYRLAAEFRPVITYGDGVGQPAITILTECRLHLGTLDGPVVNTGHGAANAWEKRYRYRRGDRVCPSCGKEGSIIKGKAEYGGGWLCFPKKGGCGSKWPDGAAAIEQQAVGDVENGDPYDLLNTLLKMSEKRSYVDATLRATATSGLYTQDMEEGEPPTARPPERAPAPDNRPVDRHGDATDPLTRMEPAPEPEIVICCVAGCGAVLDAHEIAASAKHFGVPYCTHHGKEALAAKRAAEPA